MSSELETMIRNAVKTAHDEGFKAGFESAKKQISRTILAVDAPGSVNTQPAADDSKKNVTSSKYWADFRAGKIQHNGRWHKMSRRGKRRSAGKRRSTGKKNPIFTAILKKHWADYHAGKVPHNGRYVDGRRAVFTK